MESFQKSELSSSGGKGYLVKHQECLIEIKRGGGGVSFFIRTRIALENLSGFLSLKLYIV
jgi:hypothetical protein